MTQEEEASKGGVVTESCEQMAERSGVGDGGMKVGLGLETLLLLLLLLGGKKTDCLLNLA
jgi:hypothetical protein